jgi:hypothetical protein
MKTSVRLFWWLVLLFAASLAITVVSWLTSELVSGGDRALDNMLDNTLTVAFVTAIVSGLLLIFIAPSVFHSRFQQTRTPPGGTMSRR